MLTKTKKIFLIISLLIVFNYVIQADIIVLKNGDEIQGVIKEDAKNYVDFITAEKVQLRINKDQIKKIIEKEFSFPEPTPSPTPVVEKKDDVDDLINEAKSNIDKLNKKGALTYLTKAVKMAPDNAEANYLIAQCYKDEGKNELAFKHYLKAVDLDKEKYLKSSSKDLEYLANLLISKYVSEKKDELALKVLISQILIFPDEKLLNTITDLDIKEATDNYYLAGILAKRNNYTNLSRLAFKNSLEVDPDNKKAQSELEASFAKDFTLATDYYNSRNFKASKNIIEKILSFYPDYKAAKDFLKLIKQEEEIQKDYDKLILLYEKGNYEDVRLGIQYIQKKYPNSTIEPYANALYKISMARIKIEEFKYNEAIDLCNSILNDKINDNWLSSEVQNVINIASERKKADEILSEGRILLENEEFDKAIVFFDGVIKKYKDSYVSNIALELKKKAVADKYWVEEKIRKEKIAEEKAKEEAERLRPKVGNLEGVVRVFKDNRTGTIPDPNAIITIVPISDPQKSIQKTTDSDGKYSFNDLAKGDYKVTCQFSLQDKTKSLEILIEDKKTKNLDFYWSKADILGF